MTRNPPPTIEDVLTVPEAMLLLRLGRAAIYAGCARNDIPHRRIGRHIRFSRVALMRWLAREHEEVGDVRTA